MMYVVVAHNKEDLTEHPIVITDNNIGRVLSFKQAVKLRREWNKTAPEHEYTIFKLVWCDQNKEE